MPLRKLSEVYDYSSLTRTLGIIIECSKGWLISRIMLLVLQAILPIIPLYLMKLLLDAFVGDSSPDFNYILWILIGFAVVNILSIIATNAMNYVSLMHADVIQDHMSNLIIRQSIKTDLEYFDSDKYHDKYQRALDESGARPNLFINSLSSLFQNVIGLLAILGLLFALHWSVTFLLIIIAAPVAYLRWYFTNKLVNLRVKQTQSDRRSGYFKHVLTSVEFAKEVRVFNYGKSLLKRFSKLRDQLRTEKKQLYSKRTKSVAFAQAIESAAIIIALGIIVSRAIKGLISVGDIALYFGVFQKGQSNINNALKAAVSIHENKLFLEHLFEFLDLKNKIVDPENYTPCPDHIDEIVLRNVIFRYPETKVNVLNDVSLTFKKGEMVAIVGENGSGKTTLVKLLQRLYNLEEGSIEINGININQLRLQDLRQKMTIIFQHFSKYNTTVEENIQFADINKTKDAESIKKAAKLSHADQFIDKFPNTYDTQLGRLFRDGEELSGGQWQKMALARAFYKDAEIIILDEPTSFIDPVSEEDIFEKFKLISKDKILILITHRIYNLKQADSIIVLNNGTVIEQGSHEELMRNNAHYKKMFDSQD